MRYRHYDWVCIEDVFAHNPTTGLPVPGILQRFTVLAVDDNGRPTEVSPKVLNYPHQPFVVVEVTPETQFIDYARTCQS